LLTVLDECQCVQANNCYSSDWSSIPPLA